MTMRHYDTDQTQQRLHDAETRGHYGIEALISITGAALGTMLGTLAGPPGMVAGALIGGAIGIVTGIAFDVGQRDVMHGEREIEEVEAEADRVIESRPRPPRR